MLNDAKELVAVAPPGRPRSAFISRYFQPDGRLTVGSAVALFMTLVGGISTALGLPGLLVLGPSRTMTFVDWRLAWLGVPSFVGAVVATWVLVNRFSETLTEPAPAGAWRTAGSGLVAGALAMAVAAGVPVLGGHGSLVLSSAGSSALLSAGLVTLLITAPMAVGEELVFRGVLFQVLKRGTGRPGLIIALTSAFFGVTHLANAHASLVAAVNVALAGGWLGVLAWRRSIWASMGAHVAWNTVQGFVMGQPVSGFQPGAALLQGTWAAERGFWSGGPFGPEASGWTTLVLVACLLFALLPKRAEGTVG